MATEFNLTFHTRIEDGFFAGCYAPKIPSNASIEQMMKVQLEVKMLKQAGEIIINKPRTNPPYPTLVHHVNRGFRCAA
jgi:hypothetical protein